MKFVYLYLTLKYIIKSVLFEAYMKLFSQTCFYSPKDWLSPYCRYNSDHKEMKHKTFRKRFPDKLISLAF